MFYGCWWEPREPAGNARVGAAMRGLGIEHIGSEAKEILMTWFVLPRMLGSGRHHMARSRRRLAQVEGLESRNLMTAGSVVQSGAVVTVTPSTIGPNTAIVSYGSVNGATVLDVNLNGTNHYFSLAQVGFVYYMGSGATGAQTFQNTTSLHTVAWGGSGSNLFEGGPGSDEFFGGSGVNTFDAGSGFDVLVGGLGTNVFNENAAGSGMIQELGTHNTIVVSSGPAASYQVV